MVIGTSYSESASQSHSISHSVSSEVEAGFFKLFSANLGYSFETGYDWETASEQAFGATFEITVTAPVEPGTVLYVDQAVGHCGGNEVKTELFKLTHVYFNGTESDVKYIRK